jgi:predicted Zn-dependent protease
MRNDPLGQGRYQQQEGAPRRRGLFGNVRWWILIAFAVYAAFSWFSSKETDPYTGESAHYATTPEEEVELGAQAFQEVVGDANAQGALLPPNSPQSQAVTQIAERLIKMVPKVSADLAAAHSVAPSTAYQNFEWSAAVIDSQEANAFCLPGGKIAVYTGLLPITQNTDALAVVMGHEIAHALLRHGSQRMAQQKLVQMGQMAAGVSGLDPQVMSAIGAGVQYGVVLPYGRGHETQADEVGLMLAAAACFNPEAAVPLWERMSSLGGGERPPEFASTHPDPANRIQHLQSLMPQAKQFYAKYCTQGASGAQ